VRTKTGRDGKPGAQEAFSNRGFLSHAGLENTKSAQLNWQPIVAPVPATDAGSRHGATPNVVGIHALHTPEWVLRDRKK
jgi:hypothetical protein